jgi:hypothetical protein
MPITFAGQPLLLEDIDGTLARWIERNLSLEDLRLFGAQPAAYFDGRTLPRHDMRAFVGLPTFNYPTPPRLKINALYWPTGAARWAQGLFLCDHKTLTKILAALTSGTAHLEFLEERATDKDPAERTIKAKMHLLPPRRLTGYSDKNEEPAHDAEGLYLLPLVDARYFWQYTPVDLTVTDDTEWSDVLDTLLDALPILNGRGVESYSNEYLSPPPVELTRRYENGAVLLDAVAASLGLRVTVAPSGYVSVTNATEAKKSWKKQWEEKSPLLAGGGARGLTQPIAPGKVRVVFPAYRGGIPDPAGEVWSTTADGPSGLDSDRVQTFFDTAPADLSSGSSPANESALQTLTERIATDFYAWSITSGSIATDQDRVVDAAFAGLTVWAPTGFEDYVWWHFGYQFPTWAQQDDATEDDLPDDMSDGGPYSCFTRIVTMPHNFGVTEQLHWTGGGSSGSDPSSDSSSDSSSESSDSSSDSSSESSSDGSSESESSDSDSSDSDSSDSDSRSDGSSEGSSESGSSVSGSEGSESASDCTHTIGGESIRDMPGYDGASTQVLGHVKGCLVWINVGECDPSTSGSEGSGE